MIDFIFAYYAGNIRLNPPFWPKNMRGLQSREVYLINKSGGFIL